MADTKISALSAVAAVDATDEFAVNDAGVSKKATGAQLAAFLTRATLPADARGWAFLGTATGATTTVGPVIWTGTYQQIMVKYLIRGYNVGTPVGRLLTGAASISTTAATNGSRLREGVGTENVTSVSKPGIPLAITLTAIQRGGYAIIDGSSGQLKEIDIQGHNGNPSVATPPTLFVAAGFFSDLGTNLPLQRAQLTVYDTLIATTVSSQTFTSGTYLACWGRNLD